MIFLIEVFSQDFSVYFLFSFHVYITLLKIFSNHILCPFIFLLLSFHILQILDNEKIFVTHFLKRGNKLA